MAGARPREPLAGVILAAGASRRMGRPKPLLRLDGRTYLERVVACLDAARVSPVRVVLGCRASELVPRVPDPALPVVCEAWAAGMLVSLQTGVRALREDAPEAAGALVALCDMPRIAPSTVEALVAAFVARRPPVAVPTHGDRRGHPVIFARRLWPQLLEAPADATPRTIVERHRDELLEVAVDDPWILRDADTPRQHRAMQEADPRQE